MTPVCPWLACVSVEGPLRPHSAAEVKPQEPSEVGLAGTGSETGARFGPVLGVLVDHGQVVATKAPERIWVGHLGSHAPDTHNGWP